MPSKAEGFAWLPYCGQPPFAQDIWLKWTFDPLLWLALCAVAILATRLPDQRRRTAGLWAVGCFFVAFVSPLCAASMALFSMRIIQHLFLVLIAAPLLASAFVRLPKDMLWPALGFFTALFWYWHFPHPYAQSLQSDLIYWLMHLSLLLSAACFWGCVRSAVRFDQPLMAPLAIMVAGIQMTFLAAALMFAKAPWHAWHVWAAPRLGLSGTADQQLAAALMWVGGSILVFFWLAKAAIDVFQRAQTTKTGPGIQLPRLKG